ncbi:site-specific integrase [Neotamlana laminarinivorans]|uniref:Site-specific integrase n=1 Tax=Neotamlana laminarinivorans TaxID=2883124 RepID=A0A9X1I2T3_9FLAO|nr:site-specific integrase [Tamlana laminarinivorans]MCB4800136.1 site-specific integrase [Tamlana laminarinivorans]
MKSQNTFSILFWADNSSSKSSKALLYARITVNQKRANISLKRHISYKLWDAKAKKVKGNTADARQINMYLNEVYTRLFQIYKDLIYKEEIVTAQLIKSIYTGETVFSKTLMDLIAYHKNQFKNTLSPGTIVNYGITENYLKRFLKASRKANDIYLKHLNYEFLCDFVAYLKNYWPENHPRQISNNTVMKHVQRLRKMVTLAYHMEWIDRDPFVKWKSVFEKREREFLSNIELQKMEDYQFAIDRLERVKDLFLFSCYTGISYIDLIKLTQDNLVRGIDGTTWIVTNRQKSNTRVKIPLFGMAESLINKYNNHPMSVVSGTLFPQITNEKLNFYLKEVALAVGIKKHLTFHMARHTFATTVTLSNGVPIETVSKLLGHKKIATTQIYARVLEDKISADVNQLRQQLSKKRQARNLKKGNG